MANRYINDNQTVTQVAQPTQDMLVPKLAEVGQEIIRKSQEAKIVENLSAAQLEVGHLSNQFQKQYEGDPFNEQGIKDFRSQRQDILDKYGDTVSPLFGRAWKDNAAKLASSNDITNQAWGFKQSEFNTKQSLVNTAQNNLVQTGLDGESYANGGLGLPEALLNIHQSLESMREFGNANLGSSSTEAVMHDLGQDHIKTFISSVAKTNPVKALQLMNEEGVKSEITNQEEWSKFQSAVENKALNFQDVAKQQEILNTMKLPNSMLASGEVLSYAQIQQAAGGMSEESKKYLLHLNGYGRTGEVALKPDEKFQLKAGIYDQITQLSNMDNVTPENVATLQDNIYDGMRRGALTQAEGADFLTKLVEPAIADKENEMAQYSSGQWNPFKENTGFKELQNFYDESVAIKPAEGEEKVGKVSSAINATAKANLYDNYWNSLQVQATKKGISVADIANSPDRDAIYAKAQQDAQAQYRARSSPVLKVQPSIPVTAIKRLLQNPEKAGDFDAMFGTGAANRVLGKSAPNLISSNPKPIFSNIPDPLSPENTDKIVNLYGGADE